MSRESKTACEGCRHGFAFSLRSSGGAVPFHFCCLMRARVDGDVAECGAREEDRDVASRPTDPETGRPFPSVFEAAEEGYRWRRLAENLAEREAEYRHTHDHEGPESVRTGRAWDRIRRAGDAVRGESEGAGKGVGNFDLETA